MKWRAAAAHGAVAMSQPAKLEEKTIFLLSGAGPLTAGEIAQHTGLATVSVPSLLDRLERKGFVRRLRDSADRRRVMVELDATQFAELSPVVRRSG
jgi:DNA-binding MarR family transcriptional regulator